ncbi:MAG: RNA polymerase sigma factor [Actinomycetota bacterium]
MDHARPELTDPLIDLARQGDRAALRRIHDALATRLVGYARSRGVEDPDAVANETLFRVLSGVGAFEGSADRFRSWAFTIAHNLIVDEHRRRQRRPVTADEPTAIDRPAVVDVELAATDRWDVAQTLAAIDELAPDQRDVLLLRHVADLSLAETADVLGKRVNAVKQLQHRATKALRKRLRDDPVTRGGPPSFTQVT